MLHNNRCLFGYICWNLHSVVWIWNVCSYSNQLCTIDCWRRNILGKSFLFLIRKNKMSQHFCCSSNRRFIFIGSNKKSKINFAATNLKEEKKVPKNATVLETPQKQVIFRKYDLACWNKCNIISLQWSRPIKANHIAMICNKKEMDDQVAMLKPTPFFINQW